MSTFHHAHRHDCSSPLIETLSFRGLIERFEIMLAGRRAERMALTKGTLSERRDKALARASHLKPVRRHVGRAA